MPHRGHVVLSGIKTCMGLSFLGSPSFWKSLYSDVRHKEGYRIPRTRHPALSHPCALTAARAPSSPKPRGGHLEAQLRTHSPRSGIKCVFPSAGRWKGETTSPDSAGEFLRTSHTSLAILLTFPHLVYRPTPAPCITFVTEDVSDRCLGDGTK